MNKEKRSNIQTLSFYIYIFNAGHGAVDFILDHAEIDVVFVQDKKVKEVTNKIMFFF